MRLIKELDYKYTEKKRELEEKQNAYLMSHKNRKGNEEALREVKELQNQCIELANDKVSIARQTEQLVEKCMEKLRIDSARFSSTMGQTDPQDDRTLRNLL